MNFKTIKNTMFVLAIAGTFLLPSMKADAAELSNVVSAGVATAMEQVDDETVLATAVAPSVIEGYTLLGVVKAETGYINVRSEMSRESEILGKIKKDAICEVVSIGEEWCEIQSGEIHGYMSREYLLTGARANEKALSLMEEGKELEPVYLKKGSEIVLPEAPIIEGKTFVGWFIDKELTEEYIPIPMPNYNIKLYAKYE